MFIFASCNPPNALQSKSPCAYTGFYALEDELINHIVALFNSYINAHAALCCMGIFCFASTWEEGGEEDDKYREISGAYRAYFQCLL